VKRGKKAVCVGKNYKEHITELAQLGSTWKSEQEPEPVLFLKPTTSYAYPGTPLVLPRRRAGMHFAVVNGVHHELELAVIIGKRLKDVASDEDAMSAVLAISWPLTSLSATSKLPLRTRACPGL